MCLVTEAKVRREAPSHLRQRVSIFSDGEWTAFVAAKRNRGSRKLARARDKTMKLI